MKCIQMYRYFVAGSIYSYISVMPSNAEGNEVPSSLLKTLTIVIRTNIALNLWIFYFIFYLFVYWLDVCWHRQNLFWVYRVRLTKMHIIQ